jgi:hypothetical protein
MYREMSRDPTRKNYSKLIYSVFCSFFATFAEDCLNPTLVKNLSKTHLEHMSII